MATVCIAIIISVLFSFIAPFLFAGSAAIINGIFEAFTNPFQFVAGTGETNWFTLLLSPELLNVIVKIMIAAGVVISIFILATSIFKLFFAGMTQRVESPISICVRALIAIFLSYWIIDILYDCIFPIFQWLLNKVNGITVSGGATVVETIDSFYQTGISSGSAITNALLGPNASGLSFIGALASTMTFDVFGGFLTLIVFIVFLIKIVIGLFRIISEMAERFLFINIFTVLSPLVAPTIISNSTMPIFTSWVQMMIGNGLVLIFDSLGMIMLKMAFVSVGIACSAFGSDWMKALIAMVLFNALIKVIQKFDVYMTQLTLKIQPISGNPRAMTVGGMLFTGALAGRNIANIAQMGGLKNAAKANAANVLGMFRGNRTGLAGKLNADAMDYMAKNRGRDQVFGRDEYAKTEEARKGRLNNMDVRMGDLKDPEMLKKQTEIEAQQARNNAAILRDSDFQDASREANIAAKEASALDMQDDDFIAAAANEEAARLDMNTEVMQNPDVQDAQQTHDATRLKVDASQHMSAEYIDAAKANALTNEFVKHEVGETSGVQTMRVENSARDMDIRARAAGTDLGIDAQARSMDVRARAGATDVGINAKVKDMENTQKAKDIFGAQNFDKHSDEQD